MKKQIWRNFKEARKFVHTLKLKSMDDYRKFCKSGNRPHDIPTNPGSAYKKEWISFTDWLGNGNISSQEKSRQYISYNDAKSFAQSLKLNSREEWMEYCKSDKKPMNIPTNGDQTYRDKGWESWPDFLGNSRIVKYTKSNTMPFEECKKFVRSLGVTTGSEWFKWCKKNKRPDDVPYNPNEVYKEWISWSEFLGPIPTRWRSFEDAQEFARSLKLKNPGEWNNFSKSGKRPNDIPAGPADTYKKQGKWIGWSDFLGTGNLTSKQLHEQYYSYDDAKKYVQKLEITLVTKFNEWSSKGKRPIFIPARPDHFYKEWIDWYDFLGLKKKRPFNEAREFAQSLNLKFSTDWIRLHKQGKIPKDIPRYPDVPYEKEWKGWSDFLGNTAALSGLQRNAQMRSFEECKKFVRSLGIKTENQWREWNKNNKRPNDIPYTFHKSYPHEWTTMGEFLGTGFIADKNKVWRPFNEARTIVQKLGLKNMDEYKNACNSEKIPKDIPVNPNMVYQNKGWIRPGDWLGTGNIGNSEKSKLFLSIEEAIPIYRKLCKENNIKNLSDWRKFSKTHGKLLQELHLPSKFLSVYNLEKAEKRLKK